MAKQNSKIIRFTNCHILRDHQIIREDLWVRDGRIANPEPIFFMEKRMADISIDCKNMLISPGYIDLQINGLFYIYRLCFKLFSHYFILLLGGFGYDFSNPNINLEEAIQKTATGLLKHGVTAFCPTLVDNYSLLEFLNLI